MTLSTLVLKTKNLTRHSSKKTDTRCVDYRHKRGATTFGQPPFIPKWHLADAGARYEFRHIGPLGPRGFDVRAPRLGTDIFREGGCAFAGAPPDFLAIACRATRPPAPARSLTTAHRERASTSSRDCLPGERVCLPLPPSGERRHPHPPH